MASIFASTLPAHAVGARANMEEWNAFSVTKEGASQLPFGAPVVAGTADRTGTLITAAGQNVLGIAQSVATLPHPGDYYAQYDTVSVVEYGCVGVLLGANVAAGAAARYDTVAAAWTSAAASATVLTIPGAQFDESGTSGAVGVVRYRRPVPSVSAGA